MIKKNILIISYGYPPLNDAGAQRPYALSKFLNKERFNVTVVSCENPGSALGVNKNFNPAVEHVKLIKIRSYVGGSGKSITTPQAFKKDIKTSIKKLMFNLGQKLMFPDKGMFWYPNVKRYLKQNQELVANTDIVFSTSPGVTNHRIARLVKRQNPKIKWLADFRDFNYVEHWDHKKGFKAWLHKKLEAAIIREASAVTFVTKTMQKAYQNFYPLQQHKMHCVYNGFDSNEFSISGTTEPATDMITFFYAGSFYGGIRSPKPLLILLDRALAEGLLTSDEILINIAGSIDEETKADLKSFNAFRCIHFLGSIPRSEVIKEMGRATFLWLIVGNIKSHYQTVPIKLFEYTAARRPIVNFAPAVSEPTIIIENNNLGFNFNTLNFDVEESYPLFRDLVCKYRDGQIKGGESNDLMGEFTWENQISKLENIIS